MSWTISSRLPYSKENQGLVDELKAADDDGILMFASASDQGGNNNERILPGACDGWECIRIGGASNEGDTLPWVNSDWSDYCIPAKEILFRDHKTDSFFTETGSSLANACAAGLAGALLYCDRLLEVPKSRRDLHSSSNMKKCSMVCLAPANPDSLM